MFRCPARFGKLSLATRMKGFQSTGSQPYETFCDRWFRFELNHQTEELRWDVNSTAEADVAKWFGKLAFGSVPAGEHSNKFPKLEGEMIDISRRFAGWRITWMLRLKEFVWQFGQTESATKRKSRWTLVTFDEPNRRRQPT
ncbi:MAG: hypothetical protein ACTS7I_00335 [Candidatus Hodgkinia cicadicola]